MRAFIRAVRDRELLGLLAGRRAAWRAPGRVPERLAIRGRPLLGPAAPRQLRSGRSPARPLALIPGVCARRCSTVLDDVVDARTGGCPSSIRVDGRVGVGRRRGRASDHRFGLVARVRNPERTAADTLFVGPARECSAVASSPAFGRASEYRPIGFVDVQAPPGAGALGTIADLPILLAASGTEVVVICGFLPDQQLRDVVDAALAAGCQVLSVPRVVEVAGVHPTTVWRQGRPLVQLTAPSLRGQQLFVKRLIDMVGAVIGLVLLSPVFAVLALFVKLGSAGPVFFRQERVGQGGRLFRIIKFRTMEDGAEGKRTSSSPRVCTMTLGSSRLRKIQGRLGWVAG